MPRYRVLQKCVWANVMREPGDVVDIPEGVKLNPKVYGPVNAVPAKAPGIETIHPGVAQGAEKRQPTEEDLAALTGGVAVDDEQPVDDVLS